MDSDLQQQEYEHNLQDVPREFQHQKQQVNTLTRFRSAPTSYFATFLDPGGDATPTDDLSYPRPFSPETENIFARFMSSMGDGNKSSTHRLSEIPQVSSAQPELMSRAKEECDTIIQLGNYNTTPQMMCQSYHTSLGMNSTSHTKIGVGGNTSSSLTRHSSSPAGFFDNLNIDGYGVIRGMANYGSAAGGNDHDNNDSNYNTGIPVSSWNDSISSEMFSSLGGGDYDRKIFTGQNSSDNQTGENRNGPSLLAHHLSLPNTSTELSAMEKLLHLHDVVPLRMRAKRGCATHPRSIAERVRRTKISEKMRKLQDLVPNMDKQTKTSDMLDLAVDYIKYLQNKVKNLHDKREKCRC